VTRAEILREIAALTGLLEDLKSGRRGCDAWNDAYTCPDRTEVAIAECSQEIESLHRDLAAMTGVAA
jgi:hypothetical protein